MSSAWHTAIPTLLYARDPCSIIDINERENIVGDVLNRTLNGTFECAFESEMNYDPSYFQGVSVSVSIKKLMIDKILRIHKTNVCVYNV